MNARASTRVDRDVCVGEDEAFMLLHLELFAGMQSQWVALQISRRRVAGGKGTGSTYS